MAARAKCAFFERKSGFRGEKKEKASAIREGGKANGHPPKRKKN